MATSRRREIANELVIQLKKINGGVSTFNGSYTYNINLNSNVFRRIKFIDEVNDFPSVYLQAAEEIRIYQSHEFVEAELSVVIRSYVNTETAPQDLENLALDIEHILYNLPTTTSLGILDITIDSISNDEGLMIPWGIGEIFITVQYELNH